MDAVLGVAVTGPVAHLALVGSTPQGFDVLDQSTVDVAANPVGALTDTVVGTHRLLADDQHRLVGTGVCWSDQQLADELRRLLTEAGIDVALLSEVEATTALVRNASQGGSEQTALLSVDGRTATLSTVGADDQAPPTVLGAQPIEGSDATSAAATLLGRLGAGAGAAGGVYLIGKSSDSSTDLHTVANKLQATSALPVQVADEFAIARGAALAVEPTTMTHSFAAGGAGGDATAMAPAADMTQAAAIPPAAEMTQASAQQGEQLAYSMADDSELLPMEAMDESEGEYAEEGAAPRLSSRSLLISNAVVAFAVVGFAVLAVAVAITIRPTASQQPVQGHPNAAPGKFMPPLPTQQQAPLPPVPPTANPAAVLPPGSGLPVVSGPQQGIAPAPVPPPVVPPVVPPVPPVV
ncbi:hypothetical protein, partial [Mycobacterium fragae]|uniref:hypothetical protein n=1 Tax=Mycobacterium fragae TaxID=1260918 RepID=UPI001D0AFE86